MKPLFVSEQYMRDNLPISRNLDTKDILPNILMAEEIHIQTILGSNFYEHLSSSFSGQTLNSDETNLVLNYIKPAEAYRALYLSLPFLTTQIKNKGPQLQSEDFSSSIDITYLRFIMNETGNRAEFFEKRLNSFLAQNESLFPQYETNNDGVIHPDKRTGWDSGLVFY